VGIDRAHREFQHRSHASRA